MPCNKSYGILGNFTQGKSNAVKRRRSIGLRVQRHVSHEVSAQAAGKQKLNQSSAVLSHAGHYQAPIGCRWSQNSCAYDALFTPVFTVWCSNRENWTRNIMEMGNAVADLLLQGFSRYEMDEASLEKARDDVRLLIARSRNGTPFGHYTSIENVCTHLLSTNAVVSEIYGVCLNGHEVHHSLDYNAVLSLGVNEYV